MAAAQLPSSLPAGRPPGPGPGTPSLPAGRSERGRPRGSATSPGARGHAAGTSGRRWNAPSTPRPTPRSGLPRAHSSQRRNVGARHGAATRPPGLTVSAAAGSTESEHTIWQGPPRLPRPHTQPPRGRRGRERAAEQPRVSGGTSHPSPPSSRPATMATRRQGDWPRPLPAPPLPPPSAGGRSVRAGWGRRRPEGRGARAVDCVSGEGGCGGLACPPGCPGRAACLPADWGAGCSDRGAAGVAGLSQSAPSWSSLEGALRIRNAPP